MSEYHVLADTPEGNNLRVAVHTDVPTGTNSAQPTGVSWQTAVALSRGNKGSVVPLLDPKAHGLTSGQIVETIITVPDDRNASNRLTQLEADVATEQAKVGTELATRYKYWGAEGDVA